MVTLLKSRGMTFHDIDLAINTLQRINYYRLSAYWYNDYEPNSAQSRFKVGTEFENSVELYRFDQELRRLIWHSLEGFEIAFRRQIAAVTSLDHGPFPHLLPDLSMDRAEWTKTHHTINAEYLRSREKFASHYKEKYPQLILPPIWVSVELVSFGTLTYMFKNFSSRKLRQQISLAFNLDESVLISNLEKMLQVRNACAHFSRIWNRKFSHAAKVPRNIDLRYRDLFVDSDNGRRKIFNSIVLLDYLESQIREPSNLLIDVKNLLNAHPKVDPNNMGCPSDWVRQG